MPVELKDTVAVLDGICEVAEAEPLLAWLQAHPRAAVDVSRCEHVHTAVLQVLMAAHPTLLGVRANDDRAWLGPVLQAAAPKVEP